MVIVFAPGHQMIFSNWPQVIDLRTGDFCVDGGEISIMNAASAQIANYLGLPSGIACSMSEAQAVDVRIRERFKILLKPRAMQIGETSNPLPLR